METLNDAEASALAASLGCLTERELTVLSDATPGTVEAWRKRGKGPAYVLFGNRFLYPRLAVSEHLQTLIRERSRAPIKGVL